MKSLSVDRVRTWESKSGFSVSWVSEVAPRGPRPNRTQKKIKLDENPEKEERKKERNRERKKERASLELKLNFSKSGGQ